MDESQLSEWLKENSIIYDGKIWGREEALSLEPSDIDYTCKLEQTITT
jgi:hypothetical protein